MRPVNVERGQEIAHNPPGHEPDRGQAGGVGKADHANEHVTTVVSRHGREANERRGYTAASEVVIGAGTGAFGDRRYSDSQDDG